MYKKDIITETNNKTVNFKNRLKISMEKLNPIISTEVDEAENITETRNNIILKSFF